MTIHSPKPPYGMSEPQARAAQWCAWAVAAVVTSVLLVGCDGEEIEVYELPKSVSDTPVLAAPSGGSGASVATSPPASSSGAVPTSGPRISYTLPAGWAETTPGRMVLRAFDCGAGVAATVTTFPGDVGGIDANVARWGRQLGLGPDSLGDAVSTSPVGPAGTQRVRLANAEQAVVVDIVAHNGATWFFKLTGPIEALDQSTPVFNEFVASVKLGAEAGPLEGAS